MPTRAIDVHGRGADWTWTRVFEVKRWSRIDHSLFEGLP